MISTSTFRPSTLAAAVAVLAAALVHAPLNAQDAKAAVAKSIDAQQGHYADVAKQIWGFAELGFQEHQSSALLQQQLRDAGFSVRAGVSEMPTAFAPTSSASAAK